jgi:hypothetical protein
LDAFIFPEKVLTLGSDLAVDVLASGAGPYSIVTPGNIPAGTVVNSFYLHANPAVTVNDPFINFTGTIFFDAKILGLILLDSTLGSTNAMFNVGSTVYDTIMPGLELSAIQDQFTVTGNALAYNMQTREFSDNIRILVASSEIPEPSTALFVLPGLALVALGAIRRRRGEQK